MLSGGLSENRYEPQNAVGRSDQSDRAADKSDIADSHIGADVSSHEGACSYSYIVDAGIDGHGDGGSVRGDLEDFRLEREVVTVYGQAPEDTYQDDGCRVDCGRKEQKSEDAYSCHSESDECKLVSVKVFREEIASDDSHDAEDGEDYCNQCV